MTQHRMDSGVDVVHMCRPVNTSFSAAALDSGAQFFIQTASFKHNEKKMQDDQKVAFPPSFTWQSLSKVGCSSWKHQ